MIKFVEVCAVVLVSEYLIILLPLYLWARCIKRHNKE